MPVITRRRFLAATGLSGSAIKAREPVLGARDDLVVCARPIQNSHEYIHLATFALASHPRLIYSSSRSGNNALWVRSSPSTKRFMTLPHRLYLRSVYYHITFLHNLGRLVTSISGTSPCIAVPLAGNLIR